MVLEGEPISFLHNIFSKDSVSASDEKPQKNFKNVPKLVYDICVK